MKFYRLASGFPTKSGSLLPTKRGRELPTLTLFDVASHISSFHRLTKEEKPLSQLIVSISPSKSFFPELLILSAKLTYL